MPHTILVKAVPLRKVYNIPASPFLEELSDHLFWDVDRNSVDPEKHARFLIRRIMDRGTREDARAAWAHYGPEGVKAALLAAPDLDRKRGSFHLELPASNTLYRTRIS